MLIEEILVIRNANESYGIPTKYISQVSRVPNIMELPLRPAGIRGLCAISGGVVSMVDMNLLLGVEKVNVENDKSRIIILKDELASSTILVNEVYNTVEVDQDNIDYIQREDDPVIAIYKYKDSLVQVLSLETLFSKIDKVEIESKEVQNGKVKVENTKEEDSSRFLVFKMGTEMYGLDIEYLREIILANTTFTEIAGSSEEVLGLITLREELVAVIDLRRYYGFDANNSEKNRILIAYHERKKIGLLVDEIVDIKNFLHKDIENMEEEFKDNKISGVIHDGKNLVSFFDEKVLDNLFKANESFVDSQQDIEINNEVASDIVQEVIVFKLLDKEYAFDVDSVAEIIDVVDRTKVSYTDETIDGIINIRGQIVSIVSLFKKLNLPEKLHDDSKIIVCDINDVKIGFVVDSVSDILEVRSDDIREQDDEVFTNILYLDDGKRLVLSMDINDIVSFGEDTANGLKS